MIEPPPSLRCHRANLKDVTASGAEDYWSQAERVALVEAVSGRPAEQGTIVQAAWSERELRILFTAEDQDPWATLTERDAPLYTEEVLEVFVDPFGDLQTYFEIEVNPLNAVLDLVLRRTTSGYKKDIRWKCEGLRTSVLRTPKGWNAELSIPAASLAPDSLKTGSKWRVNFLRIDRPKERERELTAWSAPGIGNFHVPLRFGTLAFVE